MMLPLIPGFCGKHEPKVSTSEVRWRSGQKPYQRNLPLQFHGQIAPQPTL
jgi:hypothetical protein